MPAVNPWQDSAKESVKDSGSDPAMGDGGAKGDGAPRKVLVLNGPNLNLLGTREPEVYGHLTLADIGQQLAGEARPLGLSVEMRQSNHEGALIDWLHGAQEEGVFAVILNAGAFTHTSVALRDAIAAIRVPVIEVHLSNTAARESFRHQSYISAVVVGTIQGFGATSYSLALAACHQMRLKAGTR